MLSSDFHAFTKSLNEFIINLDSDFMITRYASLWSGRADDKSSRLPFHRIMPLRSALSPPCADIPREHPRFVDTDIRIADHRAQVVHHIALRQPLLTPVPRQADLMHDLAIHLERSHAPRHERARFNRAALGVDRHVVCVLDVLLHREFGTDLAEQFGHQLRQPRQPMAHRARQMMFGQAIGRNYQAKRSSS